MTSTGRERVPVRILADHEEIARAVADRIAALIQTRQNEGRPAVLGLATGSTPVGIYRELIRRHLEEGLDFSGVVTFNLDEYYPMNPTSLQSYHRFMREHLFDHINVPSQNIHIPRGDLSRDEVAGHCQAFEQAIESFGGVDLLLLGIGRSGHVGFNEPGSGSDSRTRLIYLDTVTRSDASSDFFGEENVPLEAITMGVATILEAREVVLIATGEHKAAIVRRAVEGPIHPDVAATYLQRHGHATVYLDPAAAARLTRVETPWLMGEVDWTDAQETRAVTWLSAQTGTSILRLSTKDYRDHHLSALVARYGSAGPLNGKIFNRLISKIRGKSKLPAGKRVLVFSPHPDDDVISMGGLLRKLHENGNQVVVGYQTSGNIAVFDHEVRRYLDFMTRAAEDLGLDQDATLALEARVHAELERRPPAGVDAPLIRDLKRFIRETEAVSALQAVGLSRAAARFLDLPFYQTGKIKKDPLGPADIERVSVLLDEVRPDLVFAAGDLSDPHGTHRLCLESVQGALQMYSGPAPEVWLYRGAWQEWPVEEATVLVPLSEEELSKKILAIYKHQSQKDTAPFPGPDPREFWQRVQDRNRSTASVLESLGLPAYYAMEAYVVEQDGKRVSTDPVPTSAVRA